MTGKIGAPHKHSHLNDIIVIGCSSNTIERGFKTALSQTSLT
jgi:hypothetical protein